MNVEILVVSFHRDAEFCSYCLSSIQKFATGFAGVKVLVPTADLKHFAFVELWGATLLSFDEAPGKGMLHHEYQIMCADKWCPQADAILHLDSDCMFWEPATPADFFVDGKPILYRERYATLTNKHRLNWQTAVAVATGIFPEWETMVRHPAVHIPETYQKARKLIEDQNGRSAEDYILGCKGTFPQGFCEFDTLGCIAHEYFYDKYHWVDYDVRTPDGGYDYTHGRDKVCALWSHGGIERYRAKCEAILNQ